jgi:hypothetical protein
MPKPILDPYQKKKFQLKVGLPYVSFRSNDRLVPIGGVANLLSAQRTHPEMELEARF